MARIFFLGLAALAVAVAAGLFPWPSQTSLRPVAGVDPAAVPAVARSAIDRSLGGGWRPFSAAARRLQSLGPIDELGQRRLEVVPLMLRLRLFHGRDRTLAWLAEESYFGLGATGLGAAAERVFCRTAADLDLDQTAALAALIIAPSHFHRDREAWQEVRDRILTAMVEAGDITPDEAKAAMAAGIAPCAGAPTP